MASPILFIIMIFPCFQVNSQNLSFEQTILLNLKQHWGNPLSLESWNSTSSPCDWPQVECTFDVVTHLHLAEKNISGTIPSFICLLKNLTLINLSTNNISGDIPVGLYNCSNLERLDLSLNALSGTIPGELFLMEGLIRLYLQRNGLYGIIPRPIEAISLKHLNLSDNHLTGSIPDDIRNLHNLLRLDLSMNLFSGTIPSGLFLMRQLYSLSLGYNNLSGQLPAKMDLFSLHVLNLTHNLLIGTIPKTLGELPGLSSLDLSGNQLSGDIIETFLHLRSTSILRLCSNRFLGKIPHEFVFKDFDETCLDVSNLCSDNKTESLPSCPSSLCFDNRFHGYLKCSSSKQKGSNIFIIILRVVGCGIIGFAVLYYLTKNCWLKKSQIVLAKCMKFWRSDPPIKKEEKWKMISFQRLEFTETEILSSLTDENLIGQGGSGKVYRVFINQTGSAVAVKSISNSKKTNHWLNKEFLAEIQILGTIRHNNIVKLFCFISGNNMKLLVYQYFENKSLDQWLYAKKRGIISTVGNNSSVTKLDWPMRLNIAIGAAQGLLYMHHDCSPPIIHRDIKSSNILLDSKFNAKIADFGLAKLINGCGDTESASAVVGTFGYIAPEYAYTRKVNTKSDVYSFGVVLLELTTGREAVTRGDHTNLAGWAQLQYKETSAISDALDDEIKEALYLDQIIAVFRLGVICTASSPSNRPSMKDCVHILQKCRDNFSSSSPINLQLSDNLS